MAKGDEEKIGCSKKVREKIPLGLGFMKDRVFSPNPEWFYYTLMVTVLTYVLTSLRSHIKINLVSSGVDVRIFSSMLLNNAQNKVKSNGGNAVGKHK